jgi:hypothetical protein
MPRLTRAQGFMAVGSGLALVACSLGDTKSDLNDEGNPRVITVTVLSEGNPAEAATYCADPAVEKLNALYCPTGADAQPVAMVTNARPISWKVRIIFNEHLQADMVEDLLPCVDVNHNGQCDAEDEIDGYTYGSLANTQPVTLTCAGEPVPYDGYYDPTGNHLTEPGGPALVIEPIFPEAFVVTGTPDCQVTVNSEVRGKDHNPVEQRGPYSFGIAALGILSTAPAVPEPDEPPETVDPTASLQVRFNAYINLESVEGAISLDKIERDENDEITVIPVPINVTYFVDRNGNIISSTLSITAQGGLEAEAEYKLTVMSGIEDIKGGVLVIDPYEVPFTTTMSM